MAAPMQCCCSGVIRTLLQQKTTNFKHFVRYRLPKSRLRITKLGIRFKGRGKYPEDTKSLAQRLEELNIKDPELDKVINIGFPAPVKKIDVADRTKIVRELREKLEKASRHGQLVIDLNSVQTEYHKEFGPTQIKIVAEHYGIFRDLFDNAIFYPYLPLDVYYDYNEEQVTPVYSGNFILPCETKTAPHVHYKSEPDSLWTLLMTGPDSHLQQNNSEYLHWLIGNIPGNDISKGEELCNYLQPFPVQGTGHHRYVFVLFKQNKQIDYSSIKRPQNCTSLNDRTFSTLEFYRNLQDDITPASLSFYQAEWDDSVTNVFWNVLDMKEPSFEFMHPPPYHPKQVKYPHKEPFNLYLDRYRDVKDIREEVLREKLKTTSPFKERDPLPKYPFLNMYPKGPMWLRLKNKHKLLREMHWKDLD